MKLAGDSGRRLAVHCPRVRTADNRRELAVPTDAAFSSAEVSGAMALDKMMAKISTRHPSRVGTGRL